MDPLKKYRTVFCAVKTKPLQNYGEIYFFVLCGSCGRQLYLFFVVTSLLIWFILEVFISVPSSISNILYKCFCSNNAQGHIFFHFLLYSLRVGPLLLMDHRQVAHFTLLFETGYSFSQALFTGFKKTSSWDILYKVQG